MRPLSFVSTNEVSVWGDEELDVLLTQFAKEEAGSPALVNEQAARHEWSVLKPPFTQAKVPSRQNGRSLGNYQPLSC